MKKHEQKRNEREEEETHPQDRPKGKCGDRLSRSLPGGKQTAPADRGACEQETTTQGSE